MAGGDKRRARRRAAQREEEPRGANRHGVVDHEVAQLLLESRHGELQAPRTFLSDSDLYLSSRARSCGSEQAVPHTRPHALAAQLHLST